VACRRYATACGSQERGRRYATSETSSRTPHHVTPHPFPNGLTQLGVTSLNERTSASLNPHKPVTRASPHVHALTQQCSRPPAWPPKRSTGRRRGGRVLRGFAASRLRAAARTWTPYHRDRAHDDRRMEPLGRDAELVGELERDRTRLAASAPRASSPSWQGRSADADPEVWLAQRSTPSLSPERGSSSVLSAGCPPIRGGIR